MTQRLTAAEYREQTKPTTRTKAPAPANTRTPAPGAAGGAREAPQRRTDAERDRQQVAPATRALFRVATHERFDGARLVAVGLSKEQVAALRTAAQAAGVSEGQ